MSLVSSFFFPHVVVRGTAGAPRLGLGLTNLLKAVLALEKAPHDVALELHLLSVPQMRDMNYESRGIDAPTDVLTFSETGAASTAVNDIIFGDFHEDLPRSHEFHKSITTMERSSAAIADPDIRAELVDVGTIYMCIPYIWQRCRMQPTRNLPFALYLHAAVVHAELHALGYDHETPEDLQAMVRREQQLGRQLRALARRHPSLLPSLDGLEYLRGTRETWSCAR